MFVESGFMIDGCSATLDADVCGAEMTKRVTRRRSRRSRAGRSSFGKSTWRVRKRALPADGRPVSGFAGSAAAGSAEGREETSWARKLRGEGRLTVVEDIRRLVMSSRISYRADLSTHTTRK